MKGDSLSAREEEVVSLVAQGLFNSEIAYRLGITEATVKAHVGKALEKLGARNRVEIAIKVILSRRAAIAKAEEPK